MERGGDGSLVEKVIVQRLDGVKLKRFDLIRGVVDVELYSKFDDWPPGVFLQGEEALKSEEDALKVLDEYRYDLSEMVVKVKGDVAWASFYLHYRGAIRKRRFEARSRVTVILVKSGLQWRIVHEHYSLMPEVIPYLPSKAFEEEEPKGVEEPRDELDEAILKVLGDGVERSAAEISREVSKVLGRELAASKVVERCRLLALKGVVESQGWLYPKYRVKRRAS